ncbi:unnamed protein product [Clonostachys rosea]|uniref:6-phosphogluconate dehydrogenase NADP-binding domain-containing protein n=1 Tax=Bionectria ochroleuca TaxID=29856 RepID=A0ABY6UG15_BIOOC|nr:unnamed protein product [Clonostachys rosea]
MAATQSIPTPVGLLGLNGLALSMVYDLLSNPNYDVRIYDNTKALEKTRISDLGGTFCQHPKDLAADVAYLICFAGKSELEALFFSRDSSVLEVLLCSIMDTNFYNALEDHISRLGRSDLLFVDSPVSASPTNGTKVDMVVFAAGQQEALGRSSSLLHDISDQWFMIPGPLGSASKMQLIHQMLVGLHISAATEAISFAIKQGLDPFEVYNIVKTTTGSSRVFEACVPKVLDNWTVDPLLENLADDLSLITSISRSLQFPLPLSGVAEQLCRKGTTQATLKDKYGYANLMRNHSPDFPLDANTHHGSESLSSQLDGIVLDNRKFPISTIGVVGLGAIATEIATSLLRAGYAVQGYGISERTLPIEGNYLPAQSLAEAVRGTQVLIISVQSAAQVDAILFGQEELMKNLSDNTIIIISSMVPSSYMRALSDKLRHLRGDISLLDAPMGDWTTNTTNGTLNIMLSGDDCTIRKVQTLLLAMAKDISNLKLVQGGIGAASSINLINQILAGIHIAGAAEALSFAARLGLDPNIVFDVLVNTSAWSYMLENRGPQILDADWTPISPLSTFIKAAGIFIEEARQLQLFCPLSSTTNTLYTAVAANGWEDEADAGVVRFWELLTGVSVANSVLEAAQSCISRAES